MYLLKQIYEKTDCALFMFLVKFNSLNMIELMKNGKLLLCGIHSLIRYSNSNIICCQLDKLKTSFSFLWEYFLKNERMFFVFI